MSDHEPRSASSNIQTIGKVTWVLKEIKKIIKHSHPENADADFFTAYFFKPIV